MESDRRLHEGVAGLQALLRRDHGEATQGDGHAWLSERLQALPGG